MRTSNFLTALSIAILLCFTSNLQSQNSVFDQIRIEGQRVSTLMEWDSSFTTTLQERLATIERRETIDANTNDVLNQLLSHYSKIEKNNKSKVKLEFEETILNWMLPIISYNADSIKNFKAIARALPDSYYPTKILAPNLLTDSTLLIAAKNYPKEIMYAVRFMTSADALYEIENAAIVAPYEAKQYLHYSNNVNILLKQSEEPIVKKLFEVYAKYRFSSKSFYLLDLIYNDSITIDQAHKIANNREDFYNALVAIFKNEDAIGLQSVTEKLSELSDKYVRKLMFQRYLSSSRLKMDAFEVLNSDAKAYFLFNSQNLLKKRDLQNIAKLLKQEPITKLPNEITDWLPIEILAQFEARLKKEKLEATYQPLIENKVWLALRESPAYVVETFAESTNETPASTVEIATPVLPKFIVKPYAFNLSADDKNYIKFKNDPFEVLSDLSKIVGQADAKKTILYLAKHYPIEVVAQLDKFIDQPYASETVKTLATYAPLTIKNQIVKQDHKIHYFLKPSQDTTIKTLYHIHEKAGNWTRAYILLDKIVKQELNYKTADSIAKEPSILLKHLIDIYQQPEYLGQYSVEKEIEYMALDFIRNFNISENTDGSYTQKLNELDAKTIYTFLVFGEQEIISNTFQKMYARLVSLTGGNFTALLEDMRYKKADQFARMAVHYGKEYDFFNKINDQNQLFASIFKNLEESEKSETQNAVDAADIIMGMYDKNRLRDIQHIIKNEYERLEEARQDNGVLTYGILASILAQQLREGWSIYAAPHYKIPNLINIPVYSLFNEDLVNIQQYYFYNDTDGKYSYNNFRKQYEKSNYNWKIEDLGNFIKIVSKSGKSVEIYANKPQKGEEGIKQLQQYLKANNLEPQIVVHRGLSTHTLKTFNRLPSSAKLVLDGSCGGFHIQGVALKNAPDAQILCNRNIGTMYINDPMFKQISEFVRQGKDIVWPSFWSDMEARLGTNPYFKDYIPPHKNVSALILKAYYDVLGINN